MLKTYNISSNLACIVGFEAAALHAYLKEKNQKPLNIGYSEINKENPFWAKGKIEKLLCELDKIEAIKREYGKNKSNFIIEVLDTVTKPTVTEVVDSRESRTYIVILPIEGQGPTEVEMSGNQIVAYIIDKLCIINPDAVKFYRWKHERAAILDMLDQGYDPATMLHYATLLQQTHGRPFAPTITSPKEFATKFSKLAAYIYKELLARKEEASNGFVL